MVGPPGGGSAYLDGHQNPNSHSQGEYLGIPVWTWGCLDLLQPLWTPKCGQGGDGADLDWPPLPPSRMVPWADTLQRLRETVSTGRAQPAEFRRAQLRGLERFLNDNKQLLQEALAEDLHKVGGLWDREG